jgi:uncharacterized protein involved in exopolysaccharide biosynthesis
VTSGSARTELAEPAALDSALESTSKISGSGVIAVRLLIKHRRALLKWTGCALALSVLLAFLVPPQYESTARLMPPENQSGSGLALAAAAMSAAGGMSSLAGDLLNVKSTSDLFVGILSSRTVLDKIIAGFDLRKVYGLRRMEDARKELANHTTISVDRRSQIITIAVLDKRPERAARIVQAYIEGLNGLVVDLSTSSARRERIFLEGRLKDVSEDLEAAERDLGQFSSRNATLDVKDQGKALMEAVAALQAQLIATESEYQGLRSVYSDSNVRVSSLRARIEELKRQLEKLGGKAEASGNIADSPYPSVRQLPMLAVAYADLFRRAKIQEAVLETLTKEYEMAKVQESKEIPSVKVLDAAYVPDKKTFPPRTLIVVLGTIVGFSGGTCFVFISAAWKALEESDPKRQLITEVLNGLKSNEVYAAVVGRSRRFTKRSPALEKL